jgi:hypothetical protein
MIETRERIDPSQLDLKDTVVNISRVTARSSSRAASRTS